MNSLYLTGYLFVHVILLKLWTPFSLPWFNSLCANWKNGHIYYTNSYKFPEKLMWILILNIFCLYNCYAQIWLKEQLIVIEQKVSKKNIRGIGIHIITLFCSSSGVHLAIIFSVFFYHNNRDSTFQPGHFIKLYGLYRYFVYPHDFTHYIFWHTFLAKSKTQ